MCAQLPFQQQCAEDDPAECGRDELHLELFGRYDRDPRDTAPYLFLPLRVYRVAESKESRDQRTGYRVRSERNLSPGGKSARMPDREILFDE